jgi:uncharacterized protein YcbX
MSPRVTGLLVTPVKSLRITRTDEVTLGRQGIERNRRFFIVDPAGRMINGKGFSMLQAVVPEYDHTARELTLRFPDGSAAAGPVSGGTPLRASFHGRAMPALEPDGPWSAALSEFAGAPIRLVESAVEWGAVDRGREGAVSLISRATLERVAQAAGVEEVGDRRFRMLFEIDGVPAHGEDEWIGRRVRIGGAVIAPRGHVGRCAITTRDPDTGTRDVDTLNALASYRRDLDTTEPLACGVYGEIVEPGVVRVGDAVAPV